MEDFEYLSCKPGQARIANKRNKFGLVARSGATLRRHPYTNKHTFHSGIYRHSCVIAKHVATNSDWTAEDVENDLGVDDGGMTRYSKTKATSKKGKGVRCPVAQWHMAGSQVIYSMNKKKRWLLPKLLKDKIDNDRISVDRQNESNVDLTVIERETSSYRAPFADVAEVASTTLPRDKQVSRKKYGWATDRLGLSQKPKGKENESQENEAFEDAKPYVLYEICQPRPLGVYPTYHNRTFPKGNKKPRSDAKRQLRFHHQEEFRSGNADPTESSRLVPVNKEDTEPAIRQKNPPISQWLKSSDRMSPCVHKRKRSRSSKSADDGAKNSMKDRVIYELNQDEAFSDSAFSSDSGTTTADTYYDDIIKSEKETSVLLPVSYSSLVPLESLFPPLTANEAESKTIFGLCVMKSKSRPCTYAIEMKGQISCFSKTGKMTSTSAYLVLQSASDPESCMDKENCFYKNRFCSCCDYLTVRLKPLLLSEEQGLRKVFTSRSNKLKDILTRIRHGIKGLYLEKIVKIAANVLQASYDVDDGDIVLSTIPRDARFTPTVSLYSRAVMDEAASLLGFFFASISKAEVKDSMDKDERIDTDESTPCGYKEKISVDVLDYCQICYVAFSEDNNGAPAASMLKCNHWFCNDCWRHHVAATARNATARTVKCPGFNCDTEVDDVTLMAFLPGDVIARHQQRQLDNVVKRSNTFDECPKCNNLVSTTAARKQGKKNTPLSCSCGARWCQGCKGEPHWPAGCEAANLYWIEARKARRMQTLGLITSVSGRKCPACNEPIEKDGGCQMVTCICGDTFCWKCLKPFGTCMYACGKRENADSLETWEIDPRESKFSPILKIALSIRDNYNNQKLRKTRLSMCHKTAAKIASSQKEGIPTFKEKIEALLQAKKRLEKILLFCDGLHHIMQYLVLASYLAGKSKSSHSAKLKRFLTRLRFSTATIEQNLFTGEPKCCRMMALEQRMEKQIDNSTSLVQFLKAFLDKCELL